MTTIQHRVFTDASYPPWGWNAASRREQIRERIRRRVEGFINEIGVDHVVSLTEHGPTIGPFSVVVWWSQELPDTEPPVIRATPDNNQNT